MTELDPVTVDLIENALKNARSEMDSVLRRVAMSSSIREQHDEFPMIANDRGQMVVGQFGSYIPEVISKFDGSLNDGDVIILNDPYLCKGSISHTNDILVIVPIYHHRVLVGYTSQFGHVLDIGGRTPGTQTADAISIWDEGLRIPPIKLYDRGCRNDSVMKLILNNTRVPDLIEADLLGLVSACDRAKSRVLELCNRYGRDVYMATCDALLERSKIAMGRLVERYFPASPTRFWDWVDDDGLGNGPFKLQVTAWKSDGKAHLDWTGTDPQAPGSINFHIHESLCKLFVGVYLIMAYDPTILFNEGYNDVIEVLLPEGSLLNPRFPAPVSNRLNVHTRLFDCLSGVLGQAAPDLAMAAGYGTSPYLVFSGTGPDHEYFQMTELLFGGLPGRPVGDGLDGHSWWPEFSAPAAEYLETNFPVVVTAYAPALDSAGPGFHRGGAGVRKEYLFTSAGTVTVNDDRASLQPWGIGGGRAAGCSRKQIIRADGDIVLLPSKIDNVPVAAGDRLIFQTAGGGGWGNPLDRDYEDVVRDVEHGIVSAESALQNYGVVLGDPTATRRRRGHQMRSAADDKAPLFDFGLLPEGLIPPTGVKPA